jgi:hypothetical protein
MWPFERSIDHVDRPCPERRMTAHAPTQARAVAAALSR